MSALRTVKCQTKPCDPEYSHICYNNCNQHTVDNVKGNLCNLVWDKKQGG